MQHTTGCPPNITPGHAICARKDVRSRGYGYAKSTNITPGHAICARKDVQYKGSSSGTKGVGSGRGSSMRVIFRVRYVRFSRTEVSGNQTQER